MKKSMYAWGEMSYADDDEMVAMANEPSLGDVDGEMTLEKKRRSLSQKKKKKRMS